MNIALSEHFAKAYQNLPKPIQQKVKKTLVLFESNPRHPSLHVEKVDFERDIWSARIDRNYRITFQWVPGGVVLRKVDTHQGAYRRP